MKAYENEPVPPPSCIVPICRRNMPNMVKEYEEVRERRGAPRQQKGGSSMRCPAARYG